MANIDQFLGNIAEFFKKNTSVPLFLNQPRNKINTKNFVSEIEGNKVRLKDKYWKDSVLIEIDYENETVLINQEFLVSKYVKIKDYYRAHSIKDTLRYAFMAGLKYLYVDEQNRTLLFSGKYKKTSEYKEKVILLRYDAGEFHNGPIELRLLAAYQDYLEDKQANKILFIRDLGPFSRIDTILGAIITIKPGKKISYYNKEYDFSSIVSVRNNITPSIILDAFLLKDRIFDLMKLTKTCIRLNTVITSDPYFEKLDLIPCEEEPYLSVKIKSTKSTWFEIRLGLDGTVVALPADKNQEPIGKVVDLSEFFPNIEFRKKFLDSFKNGIDFLKNRYFSYFVCKMLANLAENYELIKKFPEDIIEFILEEHADLIFFLKTAKDRKVNFISVGGASYLLNNGQLFDDTAITEEKFIDSMREFISKHMILSL